MLSLLAVMFARVSNYWYIGFAIMLLGALLVGGEGRVLFDALWLVCGEVSSGWLAGVLVDLVGTRVGLVIGGNVGRTVWR